MGIKTNPQNGLPEPLGTIVLVANFCLGIWNVYSNMRQEVKQAGYDKRQQEILSLLADVKEEIRGETNESTD